MRLFPLLLLLLPGCLSLNILLFLLGTNQYERNTFEFLAQQLALRHHNVITVKPILIPEEPRLVKPKLHLVREKTLKNLLPKELYENLEKAGDVIPWQTTYEEEAYDEVYWTAHNASCYKMINSNLIDTLQKDALDVAIVYSGNPCQLAIAHVLAVPVIYYDLEGLSDETLVASNSPLNLDVVPSKCFLPEISSCHALSRIRNGICYMREYLVQSGIPFISKLISRKYRLLDHPISTMFAEDYNFKKRFKNFPPTTTLLRSTSFFFANTDPLLEFPRALSPRVVPVGGLHIDHPKPLFAPWNTSIESAKEGLIVVSLGTQANHAEMKDSQVKAILGALSKLAKYRIYWRIGHKVQLKGVKEEDVPAHINLTAYIPQNDLLAHKSCKLLVTNGGMSSLMEAVAHGVPVIGIPLYGSNRHNLRKVVNKGLGKVVSKEELTEETLLSAMKAVLQGTKYSTVAKEMSKEYRSRSTSAFATALHYIEHVGRHHGSAFFGHSPIHPIATLNFDFFMIILLMLYIVQYLVIRICCLLRCRNSSPAPQPVQPRKSRQAKKND
ncbi:UDP-glucoronosyl and UDP-glucosyl transferase [Ancylostoma duodenale]|uniref:glucuronosyltransferase n=1 Tax=Ancylostoma duodenale TaxID=51022 RepID=A0A0C2DV87_9BILA|nr:UDP-glucoronosyl and UDP-glucosyl transferase [Ancylostoma duodenale]